MKIAQFAGALLLVGVLVLSSSEIYASSALPSGLPAGERTTVFKLSDLRSAYLVRGGYVRYDPAHMTPTGIRAQLERHFDVVLGILIASTPRSVETALDRLEASSGAVWSREERAAWRWQLLQHRYVQLLRLASYRDRELFPLNEGQAAGPVPIFVDRHDTACAVGHLMRLSGWQDAVADIQATDNLVYVPDAAGSMVTRWVLTSGLTLEEAALVQPSYGPAAPYFINDYEPGELVLVKNGIQIENFHMEAQNFQLQGANIHDALDTCPDVGNCSFLTPLVGGTLPNISRVGFNTSIGLWSLGGLEAYDPIGTHWISLGGSNNFFSDPRYLGGSSEVGGVQRLQLRFDVSTLGSTSFNQIAQHIFRGFSTPSGNPSPGEYEMTSTALSGGVPIASTYFDERTMSQPERINIASTVFPKQNQLTVSSDIWLYNGQRASNYVIGLEVVPEPTTALLSVVAMLGFALSGARATAGRRG